MEMIQVVWQYEKKWSLYSLSVFYLACGAEKANQPTGTSFGEITFFLIGYLHWVAFWNFIIYVRKVCLFGRRSHLCDIFFCIQLQVYCSSFDISLKTFLQKKRGKIASRLTWFQF